MPTKLLPFLLLAALLSACAGEDGAAGNDGTSCTVTTEGGAAAIVCDDSTAILEPGACTVTSDDNGTHTITCPGGSSTVIRDGEQLPRGVIAGTAVPFGLPAEAGIEVTLVQKDLTVLTDALGQFAFEDVEPGIYSLRLTRPDYAPLDVENVLVLGAVVDVGAVEIKVGRKVATGLAMPIAFADGRHVGLFRPTSFESRADLWLLDLETGTETLIAEEAGWADILDERFLYTERSIGNGYYEFVAHDVQTGTTEIYGPARNWWTLAGGMILSIDDTLHLADFAAATVEALDADWIYTTSDDERFVVLQKSGMFATLDTASGVRSEWLSLENLTYNYWTGTIAGVRTNDAVRSLVAVDPTSGSVRLLDEDIESPSVFFFAAHANVVIAGDSGGVTVYDLDRGTNEAIVLDGAYNIGLSPNGRWITYTDSAGNWVLEVGGTTPTAIAHAWPSWFGRWMLTNASNTFRAIDAETGDVAFELEGNHGWYAPGSESPAHWVIALYNGTLVDLETGEQVSVTSGDWNYFEATNEVVMNDATTGEVILHSLTDGTIRSTGVTGEWFEVSPSGATLVIASEDGPTARLDAVSLGDLSVLPIDEQVMEFGFQGGALWYHAGVYPYFGPLAFDAFSDMFEDITLYRVVLP